MSTATKDISPRVRVRRVPKNARYEREAVYRALDRGQLAHISFVSDGQPYCIPTFYARIGDRLLIHGSSASRMLRLLSDAAPVCVTVTMLDGLVLARSALAHGANYESVVLLGTFRALTEPREKLAALEAFMEKLLPCRWSEVRPPTRQELKGTAILELPIAEASVKADSDPPSDDDPPDGDLDVWAGVVPIQTGYGAPEPSPGLRSGIALSPSVTQLVRGPAAAA
jgi:nitroimidazol reductase NimA-like FMN-containing flavoprotein (pyridoxamine 5'-phosphate oxidase superfamily)